MARAWLNRCRSKHIYGKKVLAWRCSSKAGERDEIHQVSQGVQLRQVEIQLVVLHAELTKSVQLADFSRDGTREVVLKHVELLQCLRDTGGR